jgi:hypothetical protein
MQKHRRVKSVVLKRFLEVVRLEPGFLADLCEKAGADLVPGFDRSPTAHAIEKTFAKGAGTSSP